MLHTRHETNQLVNLQHVLTLIGYTNKRQQLDFVKLMAFRNCFDLPVIPTFDNHQEISYKQKRQKELAEHILPICIETKLNAVNPQHHNRIIEDSEAQELLNTNFKTLLDGLEWLLNITQMKFLRDTFDDETVKNEKKNIGINLTRWHVTDAKNLSSIINQPLSLDYQLYQIADSLGLLKESSWPTNREVAHVVIFGGIDCYVKARINFIQPFKGNLYYLSNARGLFNNEESLSKILANFFEIPDKENEIQCVLDKHKDITDPKQWKHDLSGLKAEILSVIGKTVWCEAKTSWYYHQSELYDELAKSENRESLKDWPVAMDMVDYYLKQRGMTEPELFNQIKLLPVLAKGKNGKIANTEDLVQAWHEQFGKKILETSPEKPLIVFVSDNHQHSINFQDTIVKTILPQDKYDIITVGPSAQALSLSLATDALAKQLYAKSSNIHEKLKNAETIELKLTKPSKNDSVPALEPNIIAMAKSMTKNIDPDLVPIFVSGKWVLDGMVATHKMSDKLMGQVNIGNRIYTQDTVTLLGDGKYKVTSKSDFFSGNQAQLSFLAAMGSINTPQTKLPVSAVIDDVEYTGKEILIDKKDVYVDGVKMTNSTSNKNILKF